VTPSLAVMGFVMREIAPDAALVLALERNATGASAHRLRNLLHQYHSVCYIGDEPTVRALELKIVRTLYALHISPAKTPHT